MKRLISIFLAIVSLSSCSVKENASVQMRKGHPRVLATAEDFENLRAKIEEGDFLPLVNMHRKEIRAADIYAADTARIGMFYDQAG